MSKLHHFGILSLALVGILASGCSSDVTIGAVVSQSGALSSYGAEVKKALDLALDEINEAGGVNGGVVKLIYKDDATNPDRGRQVTEELIRQDDVRIIIGAIGSSVTLRIAPICEKHGVILLSPTSSAPKITDAGDYVYRNYPSDIVEGTAMAKFARDLGLERVAIFALDNDFGSGLSDVFRQQYEGKFRTVVKTFVFQEGETDAFDAMVAEVKTLEPDGIYVVAYVRDLAELLRCFEDAGINALKMGSASVTEELVRLAGARAENLVYPQASLDLESQEPAVASFVRAYRDRYGEDPDHYAAHGYDALKLLVEAIKLGGSAHPDDVKLGLRQIKEYEGAAGRTTFDANGDVIRYPRIFIIRDGKAMAYEKFVDGGGSLFVGS